MIKVCLLQVCYQVHGVELDGVQLGVPFSGHSNGQSLTGDGKQLGLGSFQLSVVQVDLKATLKEQIKNSQGLDSNAPFLYFSNQTGVHKDIRQSCHH